MDNTITLNRNSTRAYHSKYLAQCAVSKGRHMITLREARENVKRSTKEAAVAAGITERTLKRWEIDCGRVDAFALGRLCIFYGVSMDHIFPGKATDLLAARMEVSIVEKKTFEIDDLIVVLKQMGRDTTELENFVEEIRKSREAETKNASSAPTQETLSM
ncbi:helix-turn-helix domain-containing protein [Paenibacillus sp. HW567]|uniref:helix-turn-helix domain-containing protein n=1 Tax=Paenibacillus sp. HW567 TaxID=1034769 RepID=UPI00036ED162|nr:helix-turn-helix transcriptional regulator [Paenibacillus sp. HW567]